jgi:hypothetical protein
MFQILDSVSVFRNRRKSIPKASIALYWNQRVDCIGRANYWNYNLDSFHAVALFTTSRSSNCDTFVFSSATRVEMKHYFPPKIHRVWSEHWRNDNWQLSKNVHGRYIVYNVIIYAFSTVSFIMLRFQSLRKEHEREAAIMHARIEFPYYFTAWVTFILTSKAIRSYLAIAEIAVI